MVASAACMFALQHFVQEQLALQPVSTDISPKPYRANLRPACLFLQSEARLCHPCTTSTKQFCRPIQITCLYHKPLHLLVNSDCPVQRKYSGKRRSPVLCMLGSMKTGLPAHSEQPTHQSACKRQTTSHECTQQINCIPVYAGVKVVCQLWAGTGRTIASCVETLPSMH